MLQVLDPFVISSHNQLCYEMMISTIKRQEILNLSSVLRKWDMQLGCSMVALFFNFYFATDTFWKNDSVRTSMRRRDLVSTEVICIKISLKKNN